MCVGAMALVVVPYHSYKPCGLLAMLNDPVHMFVGAPNFCVISLSRKCHMVIDLC